MRMIDADALIAYCDEKWIPLNVDAVNAQPTVEPRAKGAWIEVYDSSVGGHNSYTCSNCGLTIVTNPDYLKKHKFCFACGADMREVTNETDGTTDEGR